MTVKKAGIFFVSFLLILTGLLSFVPGSNGDLPFYIAAALATGGKTDAEALAETKAVMRVEQSGWKMQAHIERIENAQPDILDFYRIKPMYVFMIRCLHRAGFSFFTSTLIPSLCSYFLIGVLVFSWSKKVFKPLPALIFASILMLINPTLIQARLSSPDPLSNLFIFYALYRIYFGKNYLITALILTSCVLIRLDNLIAVIIILLMMNKWPDRHTRMSTLVLILSTILVVMIAGLINYYLQPHFWWFNQITYLQSPEMYGKQVLVYILSLSASFLPAAGLLFLIVWFSRKPLISQKAACLIKAIGLIILVRFLFFPSLEERFMTSFYLCTFLILTEILLYGETANESALQQKPDVNVHNG